MITKTSKRIFFVLLYIKKKTKHTPTRQDFVKDVREREKKTNQQSVCSKDCTLIEI